MSADAVRWSCGRCGVSVGRIDCEPTLLPGTWTRVGGELFCLTCSRARAGEAAIESAPEGHSNEDLARLRRTALIQFEILRAPEAPNRTIARACRTSSAAVASIRNAMPEPVVHGDRVDAG
jgi:hypothetical protein